MAGSVPRWKRTFYQLIAAEISSLTRYYDRLLQWGRAPGDTGELLATIECPEKQLVEDPELPDASAAGHHRTAILLFGTINHHYDIESLLRQLRPRISRFTRLVIVAFNPYLQWMYRLALWLRLKSGTMPTTFITVTDLENICRLSGFEIVRMRPAVYVPWRLLGLGSFVNAVMPAVPLLRIPLTTARNAAYIVGRPRSTVRMPGPSPPCRALTNTAMSGMYR